MIRDNESNKVNVHIVSVSLFIRAYRLPLNEIGGT